MSGCSFEDIEAYVFDELGPARAAAVREHLAGCPACAAELRALSAERSLFAARAEHVRATEPLPSFAEILARPRGEVIPLWRRWVVSVGIGLPAAAAMVAGVFVASSDGGVSGRLAEGPLESPPEFSCYEGKPTGRGDSADMLDRALAQTEGAYRACLMATPPEGPTRLSSTPTQATLATPAVQAEQCVSSTPVTRASLRP